MPPPKPRKVYPDDASTQTTPFIDVLAGGATLGDRVDQFFMMGGQLGTYIASRVRIVARLSFFTEQPNDNFSQYDYSYAYYGNTTIPNGYNAVPSESPSLMYGFALGGGAIVRTNFAFSPGVAFARTDESDYGSFLGISLPFEWVTEEGVRLGFEFDLGRAFGGKVGAECIDTTVCTAGDTQSVDRPGSAAFYGHFQFGWGFSHPKPRMSDGSDPNAIR